MPAAKCRCGHDAFTDRDDKRKKAVGATSLLAATQRNISRNRQAEKNDNYGPSIAKVLPGNLVTASKNSVKYYFLILHKQVSNNSNDAMKC